MDIETTALEPLRRAIGSGESVIAVHYACESFLTAKDHPPAIASCAIYDLNSGEIIGFGRADCPPETDPVDCELAILRRVFGELSTRQESHVLHWNMDRPEFGFDALLKRWRYLTTDDPAFVAPRLRYDVDGLFDAKFGENYAPHGKLESMARLNGMDIRSFRSGKEEAEAFEAKDWALLARSSASKASIIGELTRRLLDGSAKTAVSAGQVDFAGSRLDAVRTVLAISERFLLVQRSLSKHPHGGDPVKFETEYDDQFLLRALLVQFFDDVRDEEYTPSYAGSNSRVDFVLPDFGLAIELKHTREGLRDGDLGAELLIDRERYQQHIDVTHLLVIVFDHDGILRNPRGLESDLQREHSQPGLTVTVRILDR
ncbi:hypothetical protein [Nocardioides euryhalodurans]|uniref:Uncharacterized protein n=1 Tax=Nocardioides euryhalodurans TaxID=2518370 RepID=A0A4P7GMC6_9ACTN|nr:hypothetical protein [Nocardioides euryhalodurans]QBR93286.1 hypothetical protein EXE57_14200 [Nocardioides euryhalodurans]